MEGKVLVMSATVAVASVAFSADSCFTLFLLIRAFFLLFLRAFLGEREGESSPSASLSFTSDGSRSCLEPERVRGPSADLDGPKGPPKYAAATGSSASICIKRQTGGKAGSGA